MAAGRGQNVVDSPQTIKETERAVNVQVRETFGHSGTSQDGFSSLSHGTCRVHVPCRKIACSTCINTARTWIGDQVSKRSRRWARAGQAPGAAIQGSGRHGGPILISAAEEGDSCDR